MSKVEFGWSKRACAVCVLSAMAAIGGHAQTFTTLFSFDNVDGANPEGALVQATNGNLYGTTHEGGITSSVCESGCGTVFEINPAGTLTTLRDFNPMDGAGPGALVQATNGNLYGSAESGGAYSCPGDEGCGTVFKITPSGTLTPLYSFDGPGDGTDGAYADGAIQATDGNFYGTTQLGGANAGGTVFKITLGGALTTLYSFCSQSNCTDGVEPNAGVIQASDGDFYGTTIGGGTSNYGTVFKITPSGTLTTLHSFCSQSDCTDGIFPWAALVQATNGNFYGTTSDGGTNSYGGTVFKITPSGTLTTLYSFCSESNCADGGGPLAPLMRATDGNFYGTTDAGGANSDGTVFRITPSGTLTTLYSFCSQSACVDGRFPSGGLLQATSGSFYGTTQEGGTSDACYNGCGTIFSLSIGLGPFVETQPTSGKVGASVKILGTDLTGATSVTFNGTAAAFTVASPSLITTTVPAGASTGTVQVVTPGGTLLSNVPFRVKP